MSRNSHPRPLRVLALLAASLPFWGGYAHAADARHGSSVFQEECAECHSMTAGKNKKGPSLFGVVGRNAAEVPDYVYSGALKGSGIVWSPDKLDAYIANPRKAVPGCNMKYDGLSDAAARADLIEFLRGAH